MAVSPPPGEGDEDDEDEDEDVVLGDTAGTGSLGVTSDSMAASPFRQRLGTRFGDGLGIEGIGIGLGLGIGTAAVGDSGGNAQDREGNRDMLWVPVGGARRPGLDSGGDGGMGRDVGAGGGKGAAMRSKTGRGGDPTDSEYKLVPPRERVLPSQAPPQVPQGSLLGSKTKSSPQIGRTIGMSSDLGRRPLPPADAADATMGSTETNTQRDGRDSEQSSGAAPGIGIGNGADGSEAAQALAQAN